MRFISLFAGVGGFDLGFERAGHECVLQVEQDQHCLEILRRRWPNVPKMEDVRDVTRKSAPDVDMVVGGFPCQDVSLAGNRKGLDGGRSRSGLWFEFHRIIRELRPRVAVIENVPGLFSSNGGKDFATILRGLSELGYMSAWRVLDAQHFGVPQRRRRIFIISVANPGGGSCAEILFEREGMYRNITKGRKKRPENSGESQEGTRSGNKEYKGQSASDRISGADGTSSTLNSGGGGTGAKTGLYCIQKNMVVQEGINIQTNDGGKHKRKDRPNGGMYINPTDTSLTLGSTDKTVIQETYSTPGLGDIREDTISSTLMAGQGLAGVGNEQQVPAFVQETKYSINWQSGQGGLNPQEGKTDPVVSSQTIAVYSTPGIGDIRKDDVSATITANTGGSGETQNPAYIQQSVGPLAATDYKGPRNQWLDEQKYIQQSVGALAPGAHPGGWNGQDAYTGNLIPQHAVRRLTPVECCRLQGFPDNWNDDQTDSQRYRQMGNAVCVPVAEWIGRRISTTIND